MDSSTPFQPWSSDDNSRNVKSERELVDDAKLHRENVNHPKHRQTASYNKESVVDPSVVPGPSGATGAEAFGGKASNMDSNKIASMQQIVENTLSQEGRQKVSQLLDAVEALSGTERLLLYLRLPTGVPPHDPLKQPMNPLGSRAELQQTVTWIQTHLEVDPDVSLPKQDVYDEYIAHCMSSNMKPLSTADFGKVMKQVYPSVRPRRLGTRGNSRYCYAGLRKKVKLEVPQLPDLGESTEDPSAPSRESERIICDWAESKIGVKFTNLSELCRHLATPSASPPPAGPPSLGPEEAPGPHLMKQQLKRKLQTQSTTGRPKKNKGQEAAGESPPSTSYSTQHPTVKHESDTPPEAAYGYRQAYVPVYDARSAFSYAAPPRAHPPHPPHSHPHSPHPHPPPPPPPAAPVHDYRPDPYAFDAPYAPRDLTLVSDATHLPINLSSDVSREASSERGEWRRRPPEPPPARLPLPGKKLILETYQSETRASSPRSSRTDARSARPPEEFPRAEYLPKKMRAAEILGGKLAAARQALADAGPSSSTGARPPVARRAPASPSAQAETARPEVAFLEDPKNLPNRSKSTAAALAREEQEAASPTRSVKAPTPDCNRTEPRRPEAAGDGRHAEPDSCCGINGINIVTGIICEEKHSEILNRERVISICNIDKHDLDDYLNEGNSQEHEEELMQYFHHRDGEPDSSSKSDPVTFLETGRDPPDEHSQGKSEKISQLRELLAKNLKSGSNAQNLLVNQENQTTINNTRDTHASKSSTSDGAFKHLGNVTEIVNGNNASHDCENNIRKKCDTISNENGIPACAPENTHGQVMAAAPGSHLYNGNCHTEPQSPTTRTQQYEFVPISDGCHSPGNFNSKSPLGFGRRGLSPSKTSKPVMMGGSLQTSPISHSMAASPFVSPRNTPVPRSRFCSQPIPKHNGRKRRNLLSLGVNDPCSKQFAIPNEQKYLPKTPLSGQNLKYCQPMSAPPSPNILSHFKQQIIQNAGIPNGTGNICLGFVPNAFRENVNGEISQPLSADPLSSEVSQFFQEPVVGYRIGNNQSFRSQSVPLKQGTMNNGLLSYNNTPVGSVPQTPVPNEFCDFGSLADTWDISKAGLNPENLDKIYDAIDSSNDVLNGDSTTNILNTNNTLTNGCEPLTEQQILTDEQLSSLIPGSEELLDRSSLIAGGEELLDRSGQFNESFADDPSAPNDVEEYLKRTNSLEFDLPDLVTEKNKYYTSRSVPSTPLPHKRTAPNLQIDSRHSRELFTPENYSRVTNGISSKSVPSTPQLAEDRNVFSYTNRDFLINGNSVDMCGSNQIRSAVESDQALISPLDEILGPLTPAADLLADLDKIDSTPYVDL